MRTSRAVALAAVLLLPVSGMAAATTATAATAAAARPAARQAAQPASGGIASVLRAGQRLTANPLGQGPHAELMSPSGVFALQLMGASLQLNENQTFPDGFGAGTTDWWVFKKPAHGTSLPFDKSTLRMQANGDLVMYTSKGKAIWSSHSAGTGHHNVLRVQDNGDMVVYSGSREVWKSGTTATILTARHTLLSGRRLVNKYLQSLLGVTTLAMRTDGDLVLSYNGRVIWSTRTHARGAHLALLHDGDLVIQARSGKVLWQSHTRGNDAFLELNCRQISISSRALKGINWSAPAGPAPSCG